MYAWLCVPRSWLSTSIRLGPIFLFLVLVGLLNVLFKVVGRSRERALVAAVGAVDWS